jgi:phosphate:Na+ symporter
MRGIRYDTQEHHNFDCRSESFKSLLVQIRNSNNTTFSSPFHFFLDLSMSFFQTLIAVFATIALFLHGLGGFSKEVKEVGSDYFKQLLSRITRFRLGGFTLGILMTAVIQSSSAVSSITVALVDAGVISFAHSLAVMLGANVGTTSTAWLVTLKVGEIAPVFIVFGTLISIIPAKIRVAGKSIFYFGLILFSLELISKTLGPISSEPEIIEILKYADNSLLGVLVGIIVTALVQSSSVTTGLAIILAQQGAFSTEGSIAIIIGSNVGTTSTALIASISMNRSAKLAAKANFLFNLFGVIVCYPFLGSFDNLASYFTDDIGIQVAFSHLFFNIVISILMLPFIKQFGNWLLAINAKQDFS